MTNQSPAEALRQQLYENCKSYTALAYPINRQIDELMEIVTAYAATVEREGRIDELKQLHSIFSSNTYIYENWDEQITDRLAALQGPIQGDSK